MERKIKIFKSFEEQNEYQLEQQRKTTPLERLQMLYRMQQMTLKFHPPVNKKRTLHFTNGYFTP